MMLPNKRICQLIRGVNKVKIRVLFLSLLLTVSLLSSLSYAGALLNVQGKVTDTGGQLLTGSHDLYFNLYKTETSTVPIWSETHPAVEIKEGLFNVVLGKYTVLDLPFNAQYYLSTAVDGMQEMSPRQLLGSTPYALGSLGDFAVAGNIKADGIIVRGVPLEIGASGISGSQVSGTEITGSVNNGSLYAPTSGNVGIGTATPQAMLQVGSGHYNVQSSPKLMVSGDVSAPGITDLVSINVGGVGVPAEFGGRLLFQNYDVKSAGIAGIRSGGGPGDLAFYTQSWTAGADDFTEKMRITSNGNVGIGTTTPGAKLDVAGRIWQTGTGQSVFIGEGAGAVDDLSNNWNTFVGYQAGYSNTTGFSNVANGYQALYSNTAGAYNVANGYSALYNTTGSANMAMGWRALYANTTGFNNVAIGHATADGNTTGAFNIAIGATALRSNTTGSNNIAIGEDAGHYQADGLTGLTTAGNSIYIGVNSRGFNNSDSNSIVIGYSAVGIGANSVVLGNDSITTTALKGNVGIGTTTPAYKLDVAGTINAKQVLVNGAPLAGGSNQWSNLAAPATGIYYNAGNVGIGTTEPLSPLHVNGVIRNYGLGASYYIEFAGNSIRQTGTNFHFGAQSGALIFETNGLTERMRLSKTGGLSFGDGTYTTTDPGAGNVIIQGNLGIGTTTPDEKLQVAGNIKAGADATYDIGTGATHWRNSFIRNSFTNSIEATGGVNLRYATYQNYDHIFESYITGGSGSKNESMRITSAGLVGIGTTTPTRKLDVNGNASFNGNVTWLSGGIVDPVDIRIQAGSAAAPSLRWPSTSNDSGFFSPGTNMVAYSVTGSEKFRIDASGNVGIGTTTPAYKLDVAGTINAKEVLVNGAPLAGSSNQWSNLTAPAAGVYYTAGNVGIGTTSPQVPLTVAAGGQAGIGHTTTDYVPSVSGSGVFTALGADTGNTYGEIRALSGGGGTWYNLILQKGGGRIGIGTMNPADQLEITGNLRLPTTSSSGGSINVGSNRYIHFYNNSNVFIGQGSGNFTTTGLYNYAMGSLTLDGLTSGSSNIAIGFNTLSGVSSGLSNVAIGHGSLQQLTTGSQNTVIGATAGDLAGNGSGNVFIGYGAGGNETGSNKLYIANSNTASPLVYGDFSSSILAINGNVGIGTTTPAKKLDVSGDIRILSGTGEMFFGQVKDTTDNTIRLSFADVNSDTTSDTRIRPGSNGDIVLETLSGHTGKFIFKPQTVEAMRIDSTGNVGIGTASPTAKLDVVGDIVGNAQVFRAYMTSDFSKAATWEKIPFNATVFNTLQGTFDTTNKRFTASRAGYYQISVTGYSSTAGTGSERYGIAVYKNGADEGFTGGNYSAIDTPLAGPSMIVYLNGSTDYVEIWMFSAIAATLRGGSSGGHTMFWHMNYLGR